MGMKNEFYFYLTLVRHAQTNENVTQIIQGHTDTLLNAFGEKQAAEVGESLSNLIIDQIFTSDLKRCSSTARAIQNAYTRESLSLIENNLMRERNFGLNNGKPRPEIHKFIAIAKASHRGCQMWREVKGECGHQLCEFASSQSNKPEPHFPNSDSPEKGQVLPVFLPLNQPPVSLAFTSPSNQQCIGGNNVMNGHNKPGYKGHFVLVSHGQWIREFNYILYALAENTCGFPLHREMVAVLANCQFNQFGVAVDYEKLSARVAKIRDAVTAALQNKTKAKNERFCPYDLTDIIEDLPISTVCYHARVDASSVTGGVTSAPPVVVATKKEVDEEKNEEKSKMAAAAGSGVETLYFAREDDEYAGLPEVK